MTEPSTDAPRGRVVGRAVAAAATAALMWAALALWHPTVTYHLAPGVVVLAGPLSLAWTGPVRGTGTVLLATASGAGTALAAALVLQACHALSGPTLLPGASSLTEALVVIVASGALAALWLGSRGSRKSGPT